MTDVLKARLTVIPRKTHQREDIVARVALVNVGEKPVTLNLTPLSAPSLALEIVDSAGSPLHLPPPPVPSGETQSTKVFPGHSYTLEYPGFVPQWTAEGTYQVRLRYLYQPEVAASDEWTGQLVSEYVQFSVLS
jgi:hypothetical protein